MNSYKIIGKNKVSGEVNISGNKNAALPLIAASLLTDEEIILNNVPHIADVDTMLYLLSLLGSSVKREENTVIIKSGNRFNKLTDASVDLIRGSILFLGPLISFFKTVELAPPGGDIIGLRRLDTHFSALNSMGASCLIAENGNLRVHREKLNPSDIFLEEASVTATENIIMCAALIDGISIIRNAASEPHIQDLCNMLNLMGAKIDGVGSNLLKIQGVKRLSGCNYTISSDYMETGSYIGLAAATHGELLLHNVDYQSIRVIEPSFNKIGINLIRMGNNDLLVPSKQNRIIQKSFDSKINKIDDAPWPGFPADLLSILTVTATQMNGTILLHEKMFESRMYFVDWLIRMGADIILCDPHRAVINGPSKLNGAVVSSPDVRAGMALVIAASCSEGESTINNIYQIERGYENLEDKLRTIGINITKTL
jgi:UDP-N-acetylglucosamine 1-carboxyvinyltransferase